MLAFACVRTTFGGCCVALQVVDSGIVDVNATDEEDGMNALHRAAAKGNLVRPLFFLLFFPIGHCFRVYRRWRPFCCKAVLILRVQQRLALRPMRLPRRYVALGRRAGVACSCTAVGVYVPIIERLQGLGASYRSTKTGNAQVPCYSAYGHRREGVGAQRSRQGVVVTCCAVW